MAVSMPKTAQVTLSGRVNGAAKKQDAARFTPPGKRRSVPYAVLGAALAVVFAIGFAATSLNVGGKVSYLRLVHAVRAGQVIAASDLTSAQVSADGGLGLIPASASGSVVGQSATLPLAAGTLLTQREVGPASFPPPGQTVIAVAVKTGQYPAELTPGAHVLVATAVAAGGGAQAVPLSAAPSAVVVSITPGTDAATGSVSLLADTGAASAIAAIPAAQVQLVLTSPSGS
jgi:hypothetical protein